VWIPVNWWSVESSAIFECCSSVVHHIYLSLAWRQPQTIRTDDPSETFCEVTRTNKVLDIQNQLSVKTSLCHTPMHSPNALPYPKLSLGWYNVGQHWRSHGIS